MKMKNKVLIRLFVPELDYTFDVFIPINEIIWKVKKLLAKSVSDLTSGAINPAADYTLINKVTSKVYDNNDIVANTDIRNATELLFLSVKENNIAFNKSIPIPDSPKHNATTEPKQNVLENIFEKFTAK